jgi:hypothetical protein
LFFSNNTIECKAEGGRVGFVPPLSFGHLPKGHAVPPNTTIKIFYDYFNYSNRIWGVKYKKHNVDMKIIIIYKIEIVPSPISTALALVAIGEG